MPDSQTPESCPDSGRTSPIQLSENESDSGDNRDAARVHPHKGLAVDVNDIGESGAVDVNDIGESGQAFSTFHPYDPHKQIYYCEFPDCHRSFVRQDHCARHRELHTAGGSQLPLKGTSLPKSSPEIPAAISGSASKPPAELERPNLPSVSSIVDSILGIPPISLSFLYSPPSPSSEREEHSSCDGGSTHLLREQRLSSADGSTITASSPGGLLGDALAFADIRVSADDRLLNASKYIDNIKQLRQMAFQNSAIKYTFNENTTPTNIPHDYILLRQLCDLIIKTCQSLRSLQYAAFCGHFFSVLVLDKSRSNVAQLLPIEIEKVERLCEIFEETLRKYSMTLFRTEFPELDFGLHKSQNNNPPNLPYSSSFSSTLLKAKYRKVDEQKASRTEDDLGVSIMSNIPQKLISACCDLLEQFQILPIISEPLDPVPLLAMTVQFLDLAVLSYVGTHTGDVDDLYLSQGDDIIHLPGHFGALQGMTWDSLHCVDHIILQKRQLKCLDQFLGYRTVWVFHTHINSSSNERLYLSTDVSTLADVWGPLWKSKPDANSRKVSRYDVGNGFIVPWDRDQGIDPHPSTNGEGGTEVFCHWMPTREWDDDYVELYQEKVFSKEFFESDRLLIGASTKDRLAVNDQCAISMTRKLQIKQAMKNAGSLRYRGTFRPRRERGSQTFQVQVSAMGFATLGTTLEYKRMEGFNIKDALLQRWRNGSRNIKYLEIWGGVEVSLCTENARRVQLLHLLRSPGMKRYLKTIYFQWSYPECESAYFEALKDRRSFRKFWKEHRAWRQNIGDAINECFIALEETGVDERDDALSALWVEVFDDEDELEVGDSASEFAVAEEHLVVLRRSEHTWTGLLKDSPECITMAVAESICLDFDDSNGCGMRCQCLHFSQDGRNASRYIPGYSVLQTAILVNEDLLKNSSQLCYRTSSRKRKVFTCEEEKAHAKLKNGSRRKQRSEDYALYNVECFGDACESWTGYWDVTKLSEGTEFSLGSHGHLRVIPGSSLGYPVLMEWEPVINTKGKEVKRELRERALGKSGEKHHSEYMEGAYSRSPLPCLLMSKKTGEK